MIFLNNAKGSGGPGVMTAVFLVGGLLANTTGATPLAVICWIMFAISLFVLVMDIIEGIKTIIWLIKK